MPQAIDRLGRVFELLEPEARTYIRLVNERDSLYYVYTIEQWKRELQLGNYQVLLTVR